MAILESIRQKGKLIAIVIGLALFAFILGDMIRSGRSIINQSKNDILVVNGNGISIKDYQININDAENFYRFIYQRSSLDEQTQERITASVWDDLMRNALLNKTYENLGIEISSAELKDLILGNNIHPLIYQIFSDPQTGQVNKQIILNTLKEINNNKNYYNLWNFLAQTITSQEKFSKYSNAVIKGLYVTKFETEEYLKEANTLYDLDIVAKTTRDINDNEITINDQDLKDYYQKHKDFYKNHIETRDIVFLAFNYTPSSEDSLTIYKRAEKAKEILLSKSDPENYLYKLQGEVTDPKFYSAKELKRFKIDTNLFDLVQNQKFAVYGPYLENGAYKLAVILDKAERPDTVSVRHILVSPQNPKIGSLVRAKKVADSLMTLINNGADFNKLAILYSDDNGTKTKGGLIENFTEGQMVQPFNDFSFSHKTGDIGIVQTQYGYHIIKVEKQSKPVEKLKVAFINFNIIPSGQTVSKIDGQALNIESEIRNNTFDQIVEKYNLPVFTANDITPGTKNIPNISGSADKIVKWAFKAKKGDIQNFQMTDKTVIVKLVRINEVGYLSFDKVKEDIKKAVIQEKKVEKIYNDYFKNADISSLDNLANQLKTNKIAVPAVSFNAYQISYFGYEPAILGRLNKLQLNKPYGPIKGLNGVYVVQATNIKPAQYDQATIEQTHKRLIQSLQGPVSYQIITALKNASEIKDRRAEF